MLSTQAIQGIEYIFTQAAGKTLLMDTLDVCNIEALKEQPNTSGAGTSLFPLPAGVGVNASLRNVHSNGKFVEKDIVVLTISSFLFRVLTIFHIGDDADTRDYFLKNTTGRSLTEVFSEISNLCSGAMNCELLRYFPHLGTSTPYTLSSRSLPFLNEKKSGHLSRFLITLNGTVRLQATLCMYGYAPVDFVIDKNAAAVETGELEFF